MLLFLLLIPSTMSPDQRMLDGGGGLICSRALSNVRFVPNHMDVFSFEFLEITFNFHLQSIRMAILYRPGHPGTDCAFMEEFGQFLEILSVCWEKLVIGDINYWLDNPSVKPYWLPVFHLQWLGHVPHVRQHLPTTIVWNSPMRELIGSVMVSSPLLLTFGTLSLLLYFQLPSKGRSITTLGTRWHFFLYSFLDILQFYSLHYTSFPFLKGCRLEKGHIVPVLCSHS